MDELAHKYPALNAGALCLDFANTLEPHTVAGYDRDHLGTDRRRADYAGLLAWAQYAGVIADSTSLAELAEQHPRRGNAVVRTAVALRATIYAVFAALAAGEEPSAAALAELRGHYAAAVGTAVLHPDPHGWTWGGGNELAAPLHPITASAVELLTGSAVHDVKQCAGEQCWVLFVDQTKNRSRRWCQMRYCGNVVKSRRQAARRRRDRAST
jgi:predicted RNA-binding Zn ribbon-like protein